MDPAEQGIKKMTDFQHSDMRPLAALRRAYEKVILQFRIIVALQERELLVRTEKGFLGAFGVLIEPMITVLVLLALRIIVRFKTTDLINPVVWLVVGVCLLFLFINVGIKSLSGVKKAQDIFYYRRIRPLDTLLGSALVETRIYGSTLTLTILGVWAWTWQPRFDSPGEAILVFILTIFLALGIGVSALVIGHRLPIVKLLVRFFIRRMLFWTSGIWYALYTLPGFVRPYLTWNPLLHSVELFRHAINQAYPIPDISLTYLAACSVLSCGLGLVFYTTNESLLLEDD